MAAPLALLPVQAQPQLCALLLPLPPERCQTEHPQPRVPLIHLFHPGRFSACPTQCGL